MAKHFGELNPLNGPNTSASRCYYLSLTDEETEVPLGEVTH
jgi:hypothetical protein